MRDCSHYCDWATEKLLGGKQGQIQHPALCKFSLEGGSVQNTFELGMRWHPCTQETSSVVALEKDAS